MIFTIYTGWGKDVLVIHDSIIHGSCTLPHGIFYRLPTSLYEWPHTGFDVTVVFDGWLHLCYSCYFTVYYSIAAFYLVYSNYFTAIHFTVVLELCCIQLFIYLFMYLIIYLFIYCFIVIVFILQ